MVQCNNETNKLDEIHANSRENRTKLVQVSRNLPYSHQGIHVKFVPKLNEICTNFT